MKCGDGENGVPAVFLENIGNGADINATPSRRLRLWAAARQEERRERKRVVHQGAAWWKLCYAPLVSQAEANFQYRISFKQMSSDQYTHRAHA